MRKTLSVLAALAIVAPLGAQQQAAKDPTTAVAAAPLPEGWSMKLDPQAASMTAKFVTMGQGFHVTSGGPAIYYTAKDAQGNTPYSVMANFRQTKKITGHGDAGEAFGLFIAGHDLDDQAKQTYFYFLVRQDGKFLINHRAGAERPQARRLDREPGDQEVRRCAERLERPRDQDRRRLAALPGEQHPGARHLAQGNHRCEWPDGFPREPQSRCAHRELHGDEVETGSRVEN